MAKTSIRQVSIGGTVSANKPSSLAMIEMFGLAMESTNIVLMKKPITRCLVVIYGSDDLAFVVCKAANKKIACSPRCVQAGFTVNPTTR